jgi:hypothetical protein
MNHSDNPVEVFAGTAWEAALLKSLLDNAEIESFLKDEIRGTMAPWHVSPGGSNPVKIVVAGKDVEKANEVVRDFEVNQQRNDD